MCYTPGVSFSLFLAGVLATVAIYMRSPKLVAMHVPMLLVFYSAMELLQFVQYFYVNRCESPANKVLTEIAYVFVIVQPLLWNYFFYLNSGACERNIFQVAMALASCWALMHVATRLTYSPTDSPQTQQTSVFAGSAVCTRRRESHLYWEWTSRELGDFHPTFLTHMLLWFVPALLSARHRATSAVVLLSAFVSYLYSKYFLREPFVFTSAWCFVSVPIVFVVIAADAAVVRF